MKKSHCDNCDALIGTASLSSPVATRVTVQPLGYQCIVTVEIFKTGAGAQELCASCLRSALTEFLEALR